MLFLTVGISSQLQIGCTRSGEPVDEHTIAVPVLSPAVFTWSHGRVTQLNLSATERQTPCRFVPSVAPVT